LACSGPTRVKTIWNGLDQLFFVHRLAELDIAEISKKLCSIRDRLIKGGLVINLAGSAAAIKNNLEQAAARFSAFGAVKPRAGALP
jgi:hypothetical protein